MDYKTEEKEKEEKNEGQVRVGMSRLSGSLTSVVVICKEAGVY